MSAYVIANIEVTNAERYPEYVKLAGSTPARYGGRYLVRGGWAVVKEGDAPVHRLVILEFPSMEQALTWYDSDEYRAARELRHAYARSQITFVEGVPAA